ncbi:hypothetical protein KCV07_g9905, partial [Aureobasidium melanogenum]
MYQISLLQASKISFDTISLQTCRRPDQLLINLPSAEYLPSTTPYFIHIVSDHARTIKVESSPSPTHIDDSTATNEMAAEDTDQRITLKVSGLIGGNEISMSFSVLPTIKLGKLMDLFSERYVLDSADLEMLDQDVIEVFEVPRERSDTPSSTTGIQSPASSEDDDRGKPTESVPLDESFRNGTIYNITGNAHCKIELHMNKR